MRSKQEMYEAIMNWQMEAGEDFLDYFDGNLNEFNFMFWCLGKGYINEKQLQDYENSTYAGTDFLVGDESYSVVKDDSDDSYEKGYKILADFLSSTHTYQKRVDEFLKNITRLKFEDALKEFRRPGSKIFFEIDGERTYLTKETPLTADIISKAKWYRDDNVD